MCFVLAIEEGVEQVKREKILGRSFGAPSEERGIEVKNEQSGREASILKILRVKTPPPAGVLMEAMKRHLLQVFCQ